MLNRPHNDKNMIDNELSALTNRLSDFMMDGVVWNGLVLSD